MLSGFATRRRAVKYGLPLLLLALLSMAVPLAIPREGGVLSNNYIPPRTTTSHLGLKLPNLGRTGHGRGAHVRFARAPGLGTLGRRLPTISMSLKHGLSDVRPFVEVLLPGAGKFGGAAGHGWGRSNGGVAMFGPPSGGGPRGSGLGGGGGGGGGKHGHRKKPPVFGDDDDDDDDDGPWSGDDDDDDDDGPWSGDDDDDDDDDDGDDDDGDDDDDDDGDDDDDDDGPPSGDDDDDDDSPSGDDDDDDDDSSGGEPVPEPMTVILSLMAGGALALKHRRRRRRNT